MALQQWLLRFRINNQLLREAMAQFNPRMDNSYPPWVAYQGTIANRLITLYTYPATQICAGLEAGIEGRIHAARESRKEHEDDEE